MRETTAMIKLQDITKVYPMGKRELTVLKAITLDIEQGEMVAVMGPSGSGKSTLLTLLGCLDKPTKGAMFLDGVEVTNIPEHSLYKIRREKIGFVFQTFNLIQNLSALENVELPLETTIKSGARRRERARELLAMTGMGERENHKPSQMSGGEQQRIAVARALANNPPLLLADEPTGNLDSETGLSIMNMLADLAAEGKSTILMVTHDRGMATFANRRISLKDGRLLEAEPYEKKGGRKG